ncbi:hypothetical protein AABL82_16765 [Myroides odoratimimus]
MLFSMGVSFFSSRIILKALGVEDFGIYNLVGGIVIAFTFLQNALSGATSSFFSFHIGKGDNSFLNRFFYNSVIIHYIIAIGFVLIVEPIGIYMINDVINIPLGRVESALWVFHFSVLSTFFAIITLPYTSVVISFEKMGFYAFQGVLKSFFILMISFLVLHYGGDKLIYYSVLLCVISVVLFILNFGYIRYYYKNQLHFCFKLEKEIVQPILRFFGWDLYGNFSVLVNSQGISVLLNYFYGAVINAAIGVANQVNVAVNVFVSSFMMAVKPQIIKAYALQDYARMQLLMQQLLKFSFYMLLIIGVPIFFNLEFLLSLWLVEVPQYTVVITKFILISTLIGAINTPFSYAIHATAKMKRISFIGGTFYLLVIPIGGIFLYYKYNYTAMYLIHVLLMIGALLNNVYTSKLYIKELDLKELFYKTLIPMMVCLLLSSTFVVLIEELFISKSLYANLAILALEGTCIVILVYLFGVNKLEKQKLKKMIFNKIRKC